MSQHQESEGHQEEHSNHHEGPMIVMFIFFGLLLGGLLRQINKTTKIPYTPMLLITGVFLGYARQYLGVVGEATTLIETINPHMILMIFIPVLIFESAFNCDWYVFRKSLLNIILLAGPGVLWGAILIAICFKTILFYHELSWYEVLTLGCVLSATDPVAVVALLKELGASVRFNTLVEGESLMNDGTAMVFFMLFIDLVKGNSSSASSVVFNFIRIAFGGPLLGLIIGIITSFWMKKIIRDPVLSTNITFVGAFICFYIAQFTWVRVSGILSIVVFGLYMSAVGRRRIYSESQHALHNVWGYIQYACQTLIFLLTGIVVGVQMIRQSTITIMDWVRMLLFWFLMIGLRSLMVLTLYPCLKSNGYGLSKKQLVVLIYGGLRGALGLCLSLLVGVDDSLPQRFRQITVFYMCGMAMLTIVVNGLTCGKVVNYLEMITYPEIKRKLLKRCVKDVLSNTQNKLKQLKVDPNIAYANWKQVQQLAQVKQLGSTFHERHSIESNIRDSLREIRKSQMIQEIRFRFTRYLNKVYWELYQHGQLSEDTIKILSESCDIANDEVSNRLRYFSILSSNFTPETMKVYIYFKDYAFIGGYITRLLVQKIYFIYEVSTAFLQACQETLHTFENSFPLNTDHLKYVTQQVHESMQQAVAYINEIQNNYPTIIQKVHTTRAALILLKSKKHRLKQMHEQGFIDHEDYNQLRKFIDKGIIIAQYNDFKLQQIKFNSVFTQCPLFSSLSSQEIVNIRMKSTQKSYDQKTRILNKGVELNCINIIIWGTVRQEFEDFSLIRGIGNAINPYDFTFHQNCKCIARASTDIKILQVSGTMILQLLQKYPEFKKKWYKTLFTYTMRHNKNLQFLQKTFSERQLRRFIEASEVKLLEAGEMLVSEQGSYIYEGQVQCDGSTYSRGNFLSQNKSMQALTKAIILKFVRIVGLQINNDRISVFNQE